MTITIQKKTGVEYIDTDTKSCQWLLDNGHGDFVCGDFILKKLNVALAAEPTQLIRMIMSLKAGFIKLCDGRLWALARSMASGLIDGSTFLQADYDLIDGILPA